MEVRVTNFNSTGINPIVVVTGRTADRQSEEKLYKSKILAEIICEQTTKQKLTIRDILSALEIVLDKYVADATI